MSAGPPRSRAALRVVHWYPNFLGGGAVAAAVAGLAEAQAEAGADPLIVAAEARARPLYGSFGRAGELVVPWRPAWTAARGGFLLRGIDRATRARLRSLRPDVVHVHAEFNPDNLWAPRLYSSSPTILSPHGAFDPVVLAKGRRRAKRAYVAAARPLLYRRVQAVHAVSPHEAEHARKLVPGARVYCVPHGPSPLFAEPAPARADGDPDAPVGVITIGRLDVYTKGLDLLLTAFASASVASSRLGTLVLVGPDWNDGRAELERRTRELGLDDRVRFPGRVDGNEVGEFLATADVYVQSSRHEGFSLAVAEALLAGKPVIMTREVGAGSFDEIASLPHVRLVNARADDLGRALVEFAGDLPRLREAAEAARPAVAAFLSWPRIARVHLDAYAEALASC